MQLNQDKKRLEFAIQVAQSAGEIVRDFFGATCHIESKGDYKNFLVTEADLEADRYIITHLGKIFPADSILSEEAGHIYRQAKSNIWIIDPLDRTWNFIHGIPDCGVMLTYATTNRMALAVICDPPLRMCLPTQCAAVALT